MIYMLSRCKDAIDNPTARFARMMRGIAFGGCLHLSFENNNNLNLIEQLLKDLQELRMKKDSNIYKGHKQHRI